MSLGAAAMLFNVAFVLALVLFLSNAGKFLGPKPSHEGDGNLPYETGERPIQPAVDRMAVLYRRFAVLFVVFDADLAFLLPWASNRRGLDLGHMAALTVFVGLAGFMLAYLWRKGALEC